MRRGRPILKRRDIPLTATATASDGRLRAPAFWGEIGNKWRSLAITPSAVPPDGGRNLHQHPDQRRQWLAIQARWLKRGQRDAILEALAEHRRTNDAKCIPTDGGECSVKAARRYRKKFGQYMDYPHFIEDGLPTGSGAVEGRIRHLVRRRLDIPGDWREDNLHYLLALITIRESALWKTFWDWLDQRDIRRFHGRLRGEGLNQFRGKLPKPPQLGHATERVNIDDGTGYIDVYGELDLPTIH